MRAALKFKFEIFAAALIATGIAARFFIIAHAGSWWFDESASYSLAKVPIFQLWQYLKYENNPPFYYIVLHLWSWAFGFSEFSFRCFSVLLGICVIAAIIKLGTALFSRRVGWLAGAIYAVASLAIFLDTEARMYSLLALFIVVSYIYFLKIIFGEPTRFDVAIFITVITLALYTNITALWMPVTQLAMIVAMKPKVMSRFKIAVAAALPVVLFSPWLIAFAIERLSFSKYVNAGTWWYFNHGLPWGVLFTEPLSFFNFWSGIAVPLEEISLACAVVFAGLFLRHAWKHRRMPESKLLFVALGFGVPLAVSFLTIDLGSARYYFQSAIFFWIALAYAVVYVAEKSNKKIIEAIAMAGIVCYAASNIVPVISYPVHDNWNDAARWIDAQHSNLVLAMPKLWSAEVYSPQTPFHFLPPPVAMGSDAPILNPLQMVLRYNYNWGSTSYKLTPPQETILQEELAAATATSSRIIFGYQGGDAQNVIRADLQNLGFREESEFQVIGYEDYAVVLLSRGPAGVAVAPASAIILKR